MGASNLIFFVRENGIDPGSIVAGTKYVYAFIPVEKPGLKGVDDRDKKPILQ